jgi:hypothetical protein
MAMLFADWLKSRRPLYGLSIGTVGTIMRDLRFDGGKAERDLGLSYTPIQQALHEEVASYLAKGRGRPHVRTSCLQTRG